MSPRPASPPIRPLAARIAGMVVAVCAGCALLALFVQGSQVWLETDRANRRAIDEITTGRMPALTAALWDIDTPTVQRQVDEIARHPQIAGVRLTSAGGQVFVAGVAQPEPRDAVLAVPHPPPGGAALGQLALAFNHRYADGLVLRALLQTAVGIGVMAALMAALVIRFLRRELTQPLQRIAEHARGLVPGQPAAALVLERPARGWRDDIDLVADAFGTLESSLQRYADERNEALGRLAEERDHLDATVRERTADLTRVNRFLAEVTQLSARLIDLPAGAYPDALRGALGRLASVLGAQACALAERDPQRGWVWRFVGGTAPAVIAEDGALPGLGGAADEDASPELERALGLPVWAWGHRESQAAGQLLVVVRMPPSRFGAPQGEELRLMAEVLFGALARWRNLMELDSTRERLLRQSRSDALTGVANRREFDERKLNELRRARRLQQPLSVMMVDVDHFKRFNDHYGHAAGDDCLTRVAQTLQGLFLRPFDCVARLGGEEFAVLLPDTSDETVQRQAQRVLAAIAGLNIVHAGSPAGQLSVSLGTATLSLHDASPAEAAFDRLLRAADKALYRAKAEGRGRAAHEPAA